jgi:pimeloyl-ACP methyl ester carboxylesterase
MNDDTLADPGWRHRQIDVNGLSIHVVEGGTRGNPAIVFLHGWPESWAAFEQVMLAMSGEAHVVALDLPGIGGSSPAPASNDKRTLARLVHGVIAGLGLEGVALVGHDVGGQIVYAYLREYRAALRCAVIMNVAIPGVDPWDEVKRNPHIWHFAFHAVPGLPELLVAGHEAAYFAFFYEAISAGPGAIGRRARERHVQAYSRPEALHTGFDWYRAFPQDEKDNLAAANDPVRLPVLYLRGDHERGSLQDYLAGLRAGGLQGVEGHLIEGSGHFAPEEQPAQVAALLQAFMSS